MITCYDINLHMNGAKCPTAESLGECAAITSRSALGSAAPYFTAHLYLWDAAKDLKPATVAQWFSSLGATDVEIEAVIYDPDNGILNGCHVSDGVRPWNVSYFLKNAAVTEQSDTEGGAA